MTANMNSLVYGLIEKVEKLDNRLNVLITATGANYMNDIDENSRSIFDIAELSDENNNSVFDLAEMLADLEERVSALEEK